jgi:predicted NACHT family NTPase
MASMYLDDMHGIRASAEKVFMTGGRLLIIGPPGGGKTTLLRAHARARAEVFLDPSRQSSTSARVPLYILARDLRGHFLSLRSFVQALADHCRTCLDVPTEADELERWLEVGSIELLVDGLDELGFDWNATVGELSDLFRGFAGSSRRGPLR